MRAPALFFVVLSFQVAGASLSAQPVGPPAPIGPPVPRIVQPEQKCPEPGQGNDEDIVVCGDRPENSPYRVPRQFRNLRSDDDRDASHAARQQDLNSLERFSSQTVGPGGYLQQSQQRDCAWRAERQAMRGERPDCTRQVNSIGPVGRRDR